MKGLKIFFLVLLGFLFVSVAEAKTDIQVNDGFEVVINTLDFDLVAIDYTAVGTTVNYGNYLVINLRRDIIIIKKQNTSISECIALLLDNKNTKAYKLRDNIKNNEAYSNPGKVNLSVNYTNSRNKNNRFEIPFGLRYEQVNSVII